MRKKKKRPPMMRLPQRTQYCQVIGMTNKAVTWNRSRTNPIILFTAVIYDLWLAPDIPTNIRLGWKGLPGTNTLAYYENS
jgi:hypothetical protein